MAIEKAPSKNWELTLYEMQRIPQPLITDDSEIAICPLRLSNELKCPICLDFLNNTMATKECLHRFCSQCIVTALRSGNKECPACRKKLVSKRSLRHDPNFDAIIAKLFPYRKEYEAHQATVMARQIKQSTKSIKTDSLEIVNKKADSEQVETGTNQSWSNNEAESGSSKEQSSTTSTYPPKYRNSIKYAERTSLALQTESSINVQNDEDDISVGMTEAVVPSKRMRHPSSESGGPDSNCSSSITSELCSVVGTQSRDDGSQSNLTVLGDHHKTQMPSSSSSFSDNSIDVFLEPLDGRASKMRLNETFILQVPDATMAGHLAEFLNIRRNEMLRLKAAAIDSDSNVKGRARPSIDEGGFSVFLGMASNERRVGAGGDALRQGTSTAGAARAARKSTSRRLAAAERIGAAVEEAGAPVRRRGGKKPRQGPGKARQEFVVLYYHEGAAV